MKNDLIGYLLVVFFSESGGLLHAQVIKVDVSQVVGKVSPHLLGACIEDVNHEICGGLCRQLFRAGKIGVPSVKKEK